MRIASSIRSVPKASAFAVYSGVSKRHRDVALCGEIVDLVRPRLLDDAYQVCGVGEIAIVKREALLGVMGVLIDVFDPGGVERRRAPFDAVNFVTLVE